MEQIVEVFGIDWRLILIQAINFGIVLFVLHRFLYKPVMRMLDERRSKIEKGVSDAKEAGESLMRAEEGAKKILSEADLEARDTVASGKRAAEERAEVIRKKAEEDQARVLQEAHNESERLKRVAIEESRDEIARLGILAAEKILRAKS